MSSASQRRNKAQIRNGRIVLDEPTDLPEGEIELVPIAGDDLDDEDRRRLHAALDESEDDVQAGRVRDAADVLADLRRS
jgi:hypothetical protein